MFHVLLDFSWLVLCVVALIMAFKDHPLASFGILSFAWVITVFQFGISFPRAVFHLGLLTIFSTCWWVARALRNWKKSINRRQAVGAGAPDSVPPGRSRPDRSYIEILTIFVTPLSFVAMLHGPLWVTTRIRPAFVELEPAPKGTQNIPISYLEANCGARLTQAALQRCFVSQGLSSTPTENEARPLQATWCDTLLIGETITCYEYEIYFKEGRISQAMKFRSVFGYR